jgi:Protein of unknown function (DUF3551)
MRKLVLSGGLLLGFLTVCAVLPSQPSLAYEGRWCAVLNLGADSAVEECSFDTFEACREEALRFGPTSFCHQNPHYLGYWSKPLEPSPHDYRRRYRRR